VYVVFVDRVGSLEAKWEWCFRLYWKIWD